jgi:acyl-CoA dehydrogenase
MVQVDRWAAQYAASVNFPGAKPDPKMLALIDWLRAHVPDEDAGSLGPIKGLVHGDYRLDNLVFHPTEPRIIAVS